MNMCKTFPHLTPFTLRKEKAVEVFELIRRLNEYIEYEKEGKSTVQTEPNVVVRPAGDNWF